MMAQCNTTFVFHREHNAHMPCETEKFTNVWPRRPQQGFILPPYIRLHKHPHCPKSCKIVCQTPSVLTCRNCTVCHTVCMMLYALHCTALLITPATIISQCLLCIFISGPYLCINQTNCSLGPHIIRGLSDGASVNKLNILVNNKKLQRLLKSCL